METDESVTPVPIVASCHALAGPLGSVVYATWPLAELSTATQSLIVGQEIAAKPAYPPPACVAESIRIGLVQAALPPVG